MAELYLDHVLIAVRDLAAAGRAYSELGFKVTPEGRHPDRGTHNALVVFGPEYLELIGIERPEETLLRPLLRSFLDSGEGLFSFAMGTDDIEGAYSEIRSRGVTLSSPEDGARRAPDGTVAYTWRYANVERDEAAGSDTFIIQHGRTVGERYPEPPEPTEHPNGVQGIHHLALAVRDAEEAASGWQRDFGFSRVSAGEVDGVRRVRLDLRSAYLDLVSPLGAGPLAAFLDLNGPGPYQLVLEVASLSAVTSFMGIRDVRPGRKAVDSDGAYLTLDARDARGVELSFLEAR